MRGGYIETIVPTDEYVVTVPVSGSGPSAGQVIDYPNTNQTVLLICATGADMIVAFGADATVLATNSKTGNRRNAGTKGNRRQFTVRDGAIYKFMADPALDKAFSGLSTSPDYAGELTVTVA